MSSITNHQLDEGYRRYFRNSINHEKQRLRKLIAQYPGTVFAAVLKEDLEKLSKTSTGVVPPSSPAIP